MVTQMAHARQVACNGHTDGTGSTGGDGGLWLCVCVCAELSTVDLHQSDVDVCCQVF